MMKPIQLFFFLAFFYTKGQSSNEEIIFDNHINLGIEFYELNKFEQAIIEFNNALKIYNKKPRNTMKFIDGKIEKENKFSNPGIAYYYLAIAKYHSGSPSEACENARMANIYFSNDPELDLTSAICNITAIVSAIEIYPLNINFNENETSAWNFYFEALKKLRLINKQSTYIDFSSIQKNIDTAIELSPKNGYYLFFKGLIYEIEYFTTGSPGALAYSSKIYEDAAKMDSNLLRKTVN